MSTEEPTEIGEKEYMDRSNMLLTLMETGKEEIFRDRYFDAYLTFTEVAKSAVDNPYTYNVSTLLADSMMKKMSLNANHSDNESHGLAYDSAKKRIDHLLGERVINLEDKEELMDIIHDMFNI